MEPGSSSVLTLLIEVSALEYHQHTIGLGTICKGLKLLMTKLSGMMGELIP